MDEKILNRIKKLFALAGNNSNEHEAGQAMIMARKLLDKHNLAVTDLNDNKEDVLITFCKDVNMPYVRYIFNSIADLYDCQYILSKPHHLLIGTESNRITAKIVIDFVLETIRTESRGLGNGYRNAAALGVQSQVRAILEERNKSNVEVIPGTGLVPVDIARKAKQDINDWLKGNMPNLSTRKANATSYDANGRALGANMNLGAHINGTGQRAIA